MGGNLSGHGRINKSQFNNNNKKRKIKSGSAPHSYSPVIHTMKIIWNWIVLNQLMLT